tara:strand:+ start:2199 stop:2486 length:288 start_codon:yes stop_codon:yes gene_type:complete
MNNKGAMKMSVGTIVTIVLLMTVLIIGLVFVRTIFSSEEDKEKSFALHWVCMDGCYNMLEVIYGNVTYDNGTQKNYHSKCSDKCFDMYFRGEDKE